MRILLNILRIEDLYLYPKVCKRKKLLCLCLELDLSIYDVIKSSNFYYYIYAFRMEHFCLTQKEWRHSQSSYRSKHLKKEIYFSYFSPLLHKHNNNKIITTAYTFCTALPTADLPNAKLNDSLSQAVCLFNIHCK